MDMFVRRLRKLPWAARYAIPVVILSLQGLDLLMRGSPVQSRLLAPTGILLVSLLHPLPAALIISAVMAALGGFDDYWQTHGMSLSNPLALLLEVALYALPWMAACWLVNTLMEKVEFLSAVARDTGEVIYLISPDGTVAYINEPGAELLGYDRETMIGQPMERFAPAWYIPQAYQRLATTLNQGRPLENLVHILHRSGEEKTFRVRSQAFQRHNQVYLLGVAQHVTHQLLNERLMEAAFDAIDTPAAVHSPTGALITCNQAFAHALGMPKDALSATTTLPFGLRPELLWNKATEQPALKAGRSLRKEVEVNGRSVRVFAYPVRNERGCLTATLTVFRDVTEEKRLDAQMLQAARLAAVGQVAAGVAHNINNLLTAVSVSAELIQLHPDKMGPQAAADILAAVDRGSVMVRQLYGFVGPADKPSMKRLNVADVFQGVCQILQPQMIRSKVGVQIAVSGETHVYGDANLVHQVLMNLAINALHAMPEGGTLTLACVQESKRVGLQVSDTGCGILPEDLERIFLPFFTTKREANGTGLGLSTSLAMVRSMGGDIRLTSKVGVGSTFAVWLPREAGA